MSHFLWDCSIEVRLWRVGLRGRALRHQRDGARDQHVIVITSDNTVNGLATRTSTNYKRENIGIPTLRVNYKPITNDRDKANALNNQFTSVFTSERYPIPVIVYRAFIVLQHAPS